MAAVENTNGLSLGTGIEYSWTVLNLSETGNVPNDKYFYDFNTKLVYYKDANGVIINIFDQTRVHYSEISATVNSRTNWTVKRTVVTGLRASFEIIVETDGQTNFTISDVIPANFLNKEFFKINRYTSIVKELTAWSDQKLRQGTITTTAGSAIVTGVGTVFTSDFKVGDRVGDGTVVVGWVQSIDSDTQMTFTQQAYSVVTGVNCYCLPNVSLSGLAWCAFNDLINSKADGQPTTSFQIYGSTKGQICQFEGTLGIEAEMPKDDVADITSSFEYVTTYAPKDLTASALNMDYRADNLGTLTYGSAEGKFVIVIDGYLL